METKKKQKKQKKDKKEKERKEKKKEKKKDQTELVMAQSLVQNSNKKKLVTKHGLEEVSGQINKEKKKYNLATNSEDSNRKSNPATYRAGWANRATILEKPGLAETEAESEIRKITKPRHSDNSKKLSTLKT